MPHALSLSEFLHSKDNTWKVKRRRIQMGNIPPHLTFHDPSVHSYPASPFYSILLKARWQLMTFHSLIKQIFTNALPHSFRYSGMTVLVVILGCHQQKQLYTKREEEDGRQENWPWEMDRKQGSCGQPVSRKFNHHLSAETTWSGCYFHCHHRPVLDTTIPMDKV